MQFEIVKFGSFIAKLAAPANPGRCGAEANKTYGYNLKLRVDSDSLDENDFVYDHTKIQEFFDKTFGEEPWILSCEMIGARTLVWFYNKVNGIVRIDVNITADSVEHHCFWDDSMSDPEVPAVKSKFANIGMNWANAAQPTT